MRKLLFIGVVSSALLVCQAIADQVTLKNGDRMTGTIVKSDGKTVGLHTDYAGDVTLKWDAVQSIDQRSTARGIAEWKDRSGRGHHFRRQTGDCDRGG